MTQNRKSMSIRKLGIEAWSFEQINVNQDGKETKNGHI